MLFWKFEMGLFDDPYVDPDEAERVVGCDEHRDLALTAAHEAITLLKNENNLAPLDLKQDQDHRGDRTQCGSQPAGRLQRRAEAQCHGARRHQGRRSARRSRCSTAKAARSPSAARGIRTKWCRAIRKRTAKQIAEAVRVAKKADVIVLAIGGNEQTSREAWGLNHMGDRTSLDLIGRQEELVKAMVALGKPVIVFLFNGRPLSINYVARECAGDLRVLVSGPGDRTRGCRCALRRLQPRRQAADHRAALGRPSAGVLQLQAVGAARLSVRRCVAALCVRLRAELHELHASRIRG